MSRKNKRPQGSKGDPTMPFHYEPHSQANRYRYLSTSASDGLLRVLRRLFGRRRKPLFEDRPLE
jgi:hypothetical protein